jgi:parallel beta-helix repeat protein
MRQGIAVKKKLHIRVTHNELANIDFQAIGVEGDDPSYISRDVLIADNWIHDLPAWHTDGITIFNAEDVVIRNNRIAVTSWIGIDLRTSVYHVSRVIVQDNIITRAAGRDPAFAIAVHYDPPRELSAGAAWPGSVNDITIEGNVITDCAHGISMRNVSGHNEIRNNRVENRAASLTAVGYSIDALPDANTQFCNNTGLNCARYVIAPQITSANNDLR